MDERDECFVVEVPSNPTSKVVSHDSPFETDKSASKDDSSSLPCLKVGINGAGGLVGSVLRNLFLSLGANVFASFFPSTPSQLLEDPPQNLTIHKGETNILVPEANRQAVKGRDVFIHAAAIPVHYAKEKDAARIFAVDVIGSALVSLAIHDENLERTKHSQAPMRSILMSSVASDWFEQYMLQIPDSRRAQLDAWIDQASEDFLEYSKRHHAGDDLPNEANNPIAFMQQYLSQDGGLFSIVKGAISEEEPLRDFDFYALSKLLMDKILVQMRDESLVQNALAVRPVSMLGEGLEEKEDAPFLVRAVRELLILNSKIPRTTDDPKSFPVWKRDGYYIPLENVFEIFTHLISVPQTEIQKGLEFITIPGVHIRQEDLYREVIEPTVEEAWGEGCFDRGLEIIDNPRKWEMRITDTRNIHRFIQEAHSRVNKETAVACIKRLAWQLVLQLPESEERNQRLKGVRAA